VQAPGVFVRDRPRLVAQLGDGGKDRRRVRELRKDHQADRRNGAAPAAAASIIASMRSVFPLICRRSSGLAKSVWHAAAE
jgi:hypothetical protein